MRKQITLLALLLAFVCFKTTAQDRTITGKVTSSEDKLGIPGVSVIETGTITGTSTDIDGNYKLIVSPSAKSLKFSAIGMKTKSMDLGTANSLDIVLDPDITRLEEVVVTANAITREKRSLGFATQQVKGDELTQGGNTNVIGALQGKVSGVNITSLSGAPGASQRIVIRGGTSITRNNQALFVIDGLPVDNGNFRTDNDLDNQVDYGNRNNDINPNDIESISVLKGPAAAAIYGSRASNGAVIITTKKGHRVMGGKSKMDVAFNTNVTFSSILKVPDFQNKYGQGDLDNAVDDRRENFSWGLPFDDQLRPWGQEINGQQRVKPYSAIPDNVRDFFEIGTAYNNNLSFTGGTEKSSYYLSIGTLNSKGIVPTTTYDKYSVRFNGSSELSNHFTSAISLNYTDISSSLPSGGQQSASIYDQIFQSPRDIPITESKDLNNPYNGYSDLTGKYGFYGAYTTNPYFVLENFKNHNNVDRLYGNFSITYSQWSWLSITNRFGGDIYSDRRTQKWKKYSYQPYDNFYNGNTQLYQGKYSEDIYNLSAYSNDLMFNFKRQISTDIAATLMLGQNIRQSILTNTYAQTNPEGGLSIPGYYNLDNSNGDPTAVNSLSKFRNIGYYIDLNFAYKNMLFLGFTGRNDFSSTLPISNYSYFYPSANVSFVFTELFNGKLKDDIWTYGKLRSSFAGVGNDAQPYLTTNYYSKTNIDGGFGNTQFPFGSVNGWTVGDRLANDAIKPEFTDAFDIGTELGFLKDRLSVDFSYYDIKAKEQIISLPLSPSTGYTSKTINTGVVANHGIEIGARGTPVLTKSGFKWELYGTYTKNTNEVVSLTGGVNQIPLGGTSRLAIVAQVGKPYGSFFAVDLKHVNQDDPNSPVVVDSATGLPQTTANLVYKGNYQPKFQASVGTTFSYKGFKLNVLFDIKDGGQFYTRTKDIMDFVGTALETENRDDQIWPNSVYLNSQGQYVTNTESKYHPYNYYTNVIPDGQHVIDASYVKLREASLSYQFPAKWIEHTPFGSASVSIFGNNLFIWTAKENTYADPEQNSSGASNAQGFDFTANPSQRNYGFDLKVTF